MVKFTSKTTKKAWASFVSFLGFVWLMVGCSDLSVFVPSGFQRDKDIESVVIDENGHYTVTLKKFSATSKDKHDLYFEKVDELPSGLSLTGDMDRNGAVVFKEIEIDASLAPSKKYSEALRFEAGKPLIIEETIDPDAYYIFQSVMVGSSKGRKKTLKVFVAKADMRPVASIDVQPMDNKVRLDWEPVESATHYEIYADESGRTLIGTTTETHYDFDMSQAPPENVWVRPLRGSLKTPQLKGALLSFSKVAITSIEYPDSVYRSGGTAPIKIKYSGPVYAEPGTTIDIDGSGRKAVLVSGSGTDTLIFEYPVTPGDENIPLNISTPPGVKDSEGRPVNGVIPPTPPQTLIVDNVRPSAPLSPGFSTLINGTGDLEGLWGASVDDNLAGYNAKLCVSNDCFTACSPTLQSLQSPAQFEGIAEGSYHLCVQAYDKAGLTSDWTASLAQASIQTGPTAIQSVTSSKADGNYKAGEVIPVSIHFTRTVSVTNSNQITLELETGATDRKAVYAGGSASSTLTFHYTVQAGDSTNDLQYLSPNALDLGASGTIKDVLGNNAEIVLPDLSAPESLAHGKSIRIDTIAPLAPSAVSFGTAMSATSSFSMSWVNGNDANFQTHNVKLCQASDCTTSCVNAAQSLSTPSVMTGTNGSSYYGCVQSIDTAGNTSSWVSSLAPIAVDTSPPTVLQVSSAEADGAYQSNDVLSISIQFSETVFVQNDNDITLLLETGSNDAVLSYASGSGTNTLLFQYTVANGHMTSDLNVQSANPLSLGASGTIRDASGHNATLTLAVSGGTSLSGQKNIVIDTSSPLVNAGIDIKARVAANLDASVSDTGSGLASTTWSKLSGVGTITFGDAASVDTSVSSDTQGSFTLRLTATDAAGNQSHDDMSFVWDVTPPLVDVGGDLSTNATINILATTSDALSGIASYSWTKVSGSGTITFGSPNLEDTDVTASADDTYVLRLTVTDEAGNSASDTLTLVWNTAGANVNAGPDQTVQTTAALNASTSGPSPIASYAWTQVSGPGTLTFSSPSTEDTNVDADLDGTYVLQLSVVDTAGNSATDTLSLIWDTTAPLVDAGADQSVNGSAALNATTSDALSGITTYSWTQVSGPGVATFTNSAAEDTSVTVSLDGTYVLRLTVTDAAGLSSSDTMTLIRDTALPLVQAGSDIKTNALVTLDGTASDGSGIASYQWSTVSGPGSVNFATPTAVDTGASATLEGTYVLRLTVTDTFGNSADDEMNFVWDTTPPTVNAGADVQTNATGNLDATASDSLAGIASYSWSMVSGPGAVTFGTANTEDTSANASVDGTYVLRLTVVDLAGNSSADTLTFIRDTSGPSVNVGADLKINTTTLVDATVSDAGSPIATYLWSQTSGPGTIMFGSASSQDTQVTANTNGTYVLRLTATDSVGNTSSDELTLVWDVLNPSVNAGADFHTNSSFNLDATTSDAHAGIASYAWTKVSGPGNLSFGSANAEDSTVSADADGTYVLQLSVTDQAGNIGTDTRVMVWDTTNPTVSAGVDLSANATVNLDGTLSDASSFTSILWTKISGPGTVTFGNANSEDTSVSVDADGTYVLRLTAIDAGGNTSFDEMSLIWDTLDPTVDAGPTIKTNAMTAVTGSANDGSGIATSTWTRVSGPGTITFSDASSLSTNVSATAEGTYLLRLSVTDSFGNSSHDDMTFVWDTTPATVNAGADVSSQGAISISATATDALAGISTYAWTKDSGGGNISFGTANAEDTTATADTDGVYVLRLTVTDQAGNSSFDTMNYTRDTTAPLVNVGSDRSINASTLIDASVSDATSTIASTSWTQVSGPGTVTFSAPSSVDTNVTANTNGTYVLRLTATDAVGNSSFDELTLVWDTGLPTVNAGADFYANASRNIDATASDPVSGLATYAWTRTSGPGTITFGTAAAEDTTVVASANGSYVLQLAVTDNAGNTNSDSVTMVWDTVLPTVNAGSDRNLNASATLNATVTDTSPISTFAWTKVSGPGVVTFGSATAEDTSVSMSLDGAYVLRLTATDAAGNSSSDDVSVTWDTGAPTVDAGPTVKARVASLLDGTASDASGIASYAWTKQSGTGTITFANASAIDTNASSSAEGTFTLRLTATDNFGNSAFDDMTFVWDTTAPSVNAGSDIATTTTGSINAVTSDALSGIASYSWSKVSGPGTITFGTPNAEDTTIASNADGVHVIRLTVTDEAGNSAFDEITFTKDSGVPAINAGADQTVNASTLLNGTVSDLTSSIASYSWTRVSGPGTLTFSSSTTEDTNVTASANGSYVVRLTATDAVGNSSYDEMTLIWDTAAPSVNAGADFSTNVSRLINATATDALAGISTYAWTRVSGPGTLTFGTPAAEDTTVVASAAGSYVIQLSVTDAAGNTATDTVTMVWDTTPPSVNVGADLLASSSTAIVPTVSDSSGIATYAWTRTSGPGTITFSAPSSKDTNASASADGTYVLRLTVTDNAGNSAFDELTLDWDATAPSLPASVSVGTAYSQTTSFSLSWTVSTDTRFSTHNTKICTNAACTTGCISESDSATSPVTKTGVDGGVYYGCVRGVDTLGNASAWVSSASTKTVDTSAPTGTSVSVNAGAAFTNSLSATLTLAATGATQMYVTNTSGCGSGGTWETYGTTRAWTLPNSNASSTIYAKFRDAAGNESSCASDAIVHDATAPASASVSVNSNAYTTTNANVTLTLSASDANSVSQMYITNTAGCGSGGTWETYATSKSWTLGATNATTTVYAKFRDGATNESSCVSDSIIHSNQAPTGHTISINAGAATTSPANVTLTFTANQATEMYVTNASGCGYGGEWQTYSSSKAWVIAPTTTNNATVYVKFRSASAMETTCISDAILISSVDLMTNGGFESDFTGWSMNSSPSTTNPWKISSSGAFAGSKMAYADNAVVVDDVTACLVRSLDLTSASTNYYLSYTWSYGTEEGYDFAKFYLAGTERSSQYGNQSWITEGFEVQRGGSRTLSWCYQRDGSAGRWGDFVRLDNVKAVPLLPYPVPSFTARGYHEHIHLDWPHASQKPDRYIVLGGYNPVQQYLENGKTYTNGQAVGGSWIIDIGDDNFHHDWDLTNGTTYHYGVFAATSENNYSLVATASAVPTPLHAPDTFEVISGRQKNHLSWTLDPGGQQTGFIIVRRTGSAVSFTPSNGTSYSVGNSVANSGTVVYKGNATEWRDTSVTVGTNYHYKIYAYGSGNTYSDFVLSGNATPINCNGTDANGSCWRLSGATESCNTTCRSAGMAFEPNRLDTLISDGSTNKQTQCNTILNAMGVTGGGYWSVSGPKNCVKLLDGNLLWRGDSQSDGDFIQHDGQLACPCY